MEILSSAVDAAVDDFVEKKKNNKDLVGVINISYEVNPNFKLTTALRRVSL